jgi:hypothetical protein
VRALAVQNSCLLVKLLHRLHVDCRSPGPPGSGLRLEAPPSSTAPALLRMVSTGWPSARSSRSTVPPRK